MASCSDRECVRAVFVTIGIYRCWSVRVRIHGQVAAAAVQDFYLHFSSVLTGCLLSVQCWYASCMFAWVEFFCSRISAFTVAKNVFLSCISSAMLLTYDADVAFLPSMHPSACLSHSDIVSRHLCEVPAGSPHTGASSTSMVYIFSNFLSASATKGFTSHVFLPGETTPSVWNLCQQTHWSRNGWMDNGCSSCGAYTLTAESMQQPQSVCVGH